MPYEDEDFLQQRKRLLMLNAQGIQNQLNSSYPNGPDVQRPEQSPAIQQPEVAAPPVLQAEGARPPVSFGISPVETPAPQGPSPFQQVLHREPMEKDFHPSTARKIGGILSGVLGGVLSGSPEYGMKVAHNVDYAPYKQQHSQWEQQLQNLYSGEQEQQGVDKNKATIEHLKAQSQAEVARKEAQEATKRGIEYKQTPEYQQNQVKLAEAKEKGTPHNVTLTDGTKLWALQPQKDGFHDPKNGLRIPDELVKSIEETDPKGTTGSDFQTFLKDPKAQQLWEQFNKGKAESKPPVDPLIHDNRVLDHAIKEKTLAGDTTGTVAPQSSPTQKPIERFNPDQRGDVNTAINVLSGSVAQGFGGKTKEKVNRGITYISQVTGLSPEEINARSQARKDAQKSYAQLKSREGAVESLANTLNRHGKVLVDLRNQLPDADITLINKMLLSGAREFDLSGLSDPSVSHNSVRYAMAMQAIRNDYARVVQGAALSRAQTSPQTLKEVGAKMSEGFSKGNTQAMVDQISTEVKQSTAGQQDQLKTLFDEVSSPLYPELYGNPYQFMKPTAPAPTGGTGSTSQRKIQVFSVK